MTTHIPVPPNFLAAPEGINTASPLLAPSLLTKLHTLYPPLTQPSPTLLYSIMSLARSFLNDFRPLFRMLEDPFMTAPFSRVRPTAFEPFAFQRQASVEISEEGNDIVVQAEVPGVQKENLDVHLGNNGQSLTIEGRVHRLNKSNAPAIEQAKPDAGENTTQGRLLSASLSPLTFADPRLSDLVKSNSSAEVPAESELRSSFTRTLWLPQRVDGQKASAQLADGILTLRIPKVAEPAAERIAII